MRGRRNPAAPPAHQCSPLFVLSAATALTVNGQRARRVPMDFHNPSQHTLPNLTRIETILADGAISTGQALYFASQLASQGHPATAEVISTLREKVSHSQVLQAADFIERVNEEVRRHFRLEHLSSAIREEVYKREGATFVPATERSRKLLVVFATMFNNFHISIAALLAMLKPLNCNFLVLRDSSLLNYHSGVEGFAENIPGIARAISKFADRKGFEQVYICGYSSCGYAALMASLLMPCSGYLGFSQPIDMSDGSDFDPPFYFTSDVRAFVGEKHLIDLKPLLADADPTVPRTFIYGEKNAKDSAHASYIHDLAHLKFIALTETDHSTVERLVANGELIRLFSRLISP